jgi:hypothetical protein
MAIDALEKLIQASNETSFTLYPAELIIRHSCGC